MSILGHRVLRKEDPGILTGRTQFVADVRDPLLDGAVHVTYVRSTMAHARIVDIDAADARWPRRACSACSPRPTSG